MSHKNKNRFEGWSDADVAKNIELEKEISSRKSAGTLGSAFGFLMLLTAPLDGIGFAAVIISMIGWALYQVTYINKAESRLIELNQKYLPWPP